MKSKEELEAILSRAALAPYKPARASGCGRAYVAVSGLDRNELRALGAAAKKVGLMFLRKAYGTGGNVLYVGYDNADGRALGQAAAMAEVLNAAGVSAYVDAVAD